MTDRTLNFPGIGDVKVTTSHAMEQQRAARAHARAQHTPNPDKVRDYKVYRDIKDTARAAVGYTKDSPIYGKTTLEVLQEVKGIIDTFTDRSEQGAKVETLITELLRREIADVEASKAYRNRIKR